MKNLRKVLLPVDIAFLYTVYFLLLLISVYTLACIGFFVGLPVNAFYFPLSLIVSAVLFFMQLRKKLSLFLTLKHLVFVHLYLLVALCICIYFFDTSYDGLWYHQPAIIRLAEGWNPVHGPYYLTNQYDASNYLWIQHYPKASWTIAACIYKLTGMVESGKLLNFIVLAAVFCYAYYVLSNLFKQNQFLIIAFALLISLSPVATSQLLSDYLDGILSGMLTLIVLCLLDMQLSRDFRSLWKWFILATAMIIVSNLKFTGLFMAGIIIAIFSLYWWWKREPVLEIIRRYILIGAFAVVAFVVFGFNPYVTNVYYKKHIFYPLNEKDKYALIIQNQPDVLDGKNNLTQLFISVFSAAENDMHKPAIKWKNPLTVTRNDIREFAGTDVRLGGLGPVFLLALLVSLVTLVLFLKELDKKEKTLLTVILSGIFLSVVLAPMGWWARYTPQFFLIPVIISGFAFYAMQKKDMKGFKKFLPRILLILLSLNIVVIAGSNITANVIKTGLIKKETKELQARKDTILINFSKTELQAARKRLQEAGIHFTDCDTLKTNVQELRTIYNLYGLGPVYNKVK